MSVLSHNITFQIKIIIIINIKRKQEPFLNSTNNMAIILGGGIGGLSAAYYLLRQIPAGQRTIQLFESSNRLGGWIRSEASGSNGHGNVLFEGGPRTLRPIGIKGRNTLELCSDLGLNSKILPIKSTHPAARNRMIYVNGQLCPLPTSILSVFRKLPPFSKPLYKAALQDLSMGRPKGITDDTIYNFTERRFGTEIAKYAVSSMICGICAGDAKEISVKFLMKELFEYEHKYGSVLKGVLQSVLNSRKETKKHGVKCDLVQQSEVDRWSIYSFKGGMQTLTQTIIEHLQKNDVALTLNAPCDRIEFIDQKAIVTTNGAQHTTDCLISSLPSHQIAKLVQEQHPKLAAELLDIPHVDVAVVNLQYSGELLKNPGFGFLVPPTENLPILGVIYDSCCFEMKGKTVLTVMMGGKWFNERLGANVTSDELLQIACNQVENILKITTKPEATKVNILRRCIPQYVVGHSDRIDRIFKYIKENELPIRLCGSAYDGVGVNDVIHSAKQAVLQEQ